MAILLRNVKGEPLTIAEMDGNLSELDARIKALEDLSHAENSLHIESQHDALIFKNGLGIEMGRAILPKWMPRIRGEWQPGEAYAFGDWVRYLGKMYFCKVPHVAPFTIAGSDDVFVNQNWELLMG